MSLDAASRLPGNAVPLENTPRREASLPHEARLLPENAIKRTSAHAALVAVAAMTKINILVRQMVGKSPTKPVQSNHLAHHVIR